MRFEIKLDERLSTTIAATWDVGNYTGAIIASVQFLSDMIRNKSGVEADGQTLVGQAFGGANPVVKLNQLRSESEKDEQKGVELLLRGIYTGVRNPRSHELRQDSAETATAVIALVNWLLSVIDGSKTPFDPDNVIDRVLDEHFVASEKYATLLVSEVPARIRFDVLLRLIDRVTSPKAFDAQVFITEMLRTMNESEQKQFWEFVSARLLTSSTEAELVVLVRIAAQNWLNCSELGRLRTENRLLKAIREGK